MYRTKQAVEASADSIAAAVLWRKERSAAPRGMLARLLCQHTDPAAGQAPQRAWPQSFRQSVMQLGVDVCQHVQQLLEGGLPLKRHRTSSSNPAHVNKLLCPAVGLYAAGTDGSLEWFAGSLMRLDETGWLCARFSDGDVEDFAAADVYWVLPGGE